MSSKRKNKLNKYKLKEKEKIALNYHFLIG